MKILMLYNEFRSAFGGEDKVVSDMVSLFKRNEVDVFLETRSSKDLSLAGKVSAFLGGSFNVLSYRSMVRLIEDERPDVVHVHNLYPFFSPSVLVASRRAGVPTVMTLHNFGLICPHWSHFRKGEICEKCASATTLWCVLNNCQGSLIESVGYSVRSEAARRFGLFRKNVSAFIALTEFAKNRLVSAGYSSNRIVVFPNPVEKPESSAKLRGRKFVAFAGRMSEEKGVECLLAAARMLPDLAFELAGDGPLFARLKKESPENVVFRGRLNAGELAAFYSDARVLVVPSMCFEMCPTVLLEGMAMALPAVVSRSGGLPELVSDDETGVLFERGNSVDLAAKIRMLWDDPEMSVRLGEAGRRWTERECSETVYFDRLMRVYRGVIDGRTEISL